MAPTSITTNSPTRKKGISSGFRYKTVPHVTLKSIANNPEIREGMTREQIDLAIARYADQETLYDQPYIDKSRVRVTGRLRLKPFRLPRSDRWMTLK